MVLVLIQLFERDAPVLSVEVSDLSESVAQLVESRCGASSSVFGLSLTPEVFIVPDEIPIGSILISGRSSLPTFYLRPKSFDRWWDSLQQEQQIRCQLACCYRLVREYGWDDTIYGHLTTRSTLGGFLINPFGLLYSEICASSLVRVDLDGTILDGGCFADKYGINRAGYVIHSAIHASRQDVHAVFHTHQPDCVAVSCLQSGLLPISQTSHILGEVSYHRYEGIAVDEAERDRLTCDLGSTNKVLFLRNHGVVTCGSCIGEALLLMWNTVQACRFQLRVQSSAGGSPESGGASGWLTPSKDIQKRSHDIATAFNKEGAGQKEIMAFVRDMFRRDPSFCW